MIPQDSKLAMRTTSGNKKPFLLALTIPIPARMATAFPIPVGLTGVLPKIGLELQSSDIECNNYPSLIYKSMGGQTERRQSLEKGKCGQTQSQPGLPEQV